MNLAVVAYSDLGTDGHVLANRAVVTDLGVLEHVGEVPDLGAFADCCRVIDDCRLVHKGSIVLIRVDLFTNSLINFCQQIRVNTNSDLYQLVDLGLGCIYKANSFSHDKQAERSDQSNIKKFGTFPGLQVIKISFSKKNYRGRIQYEDAIHTRLLRALRWLYIEMGIL